MGRSLRAPATLLHLLSSRRHVGDLGEELARYLTCVGDFRPSCWATLSSTFFRVTSFLLTSLS